MKTKRVTLKRKPTARQRKQELELRERFQREKPTLDQLVASREYFGPVPHGLVLDMMADLAQLREERKRSGLSLGDVSSRSGIDKGALSRLERGQDVNPTYQTLARYAAAFGRKIRLVTEPA